MWERQYKTFKAEETPLCVSLAELLCHCHLPFLHSLSCFGNMKLLAGFACMLIILLFENTESTDSRSTAGYPSLPDSKHAEEKVFLTLGNEDNTRVKRGSQDDKLKKDPALLGYPRLMKSPTSRPPILNQFFNASVPSSTWGPKIVNSLYPFGENSLSAYGVLLLSLVVFAVGIVGNLSIMCIVWHSMSMKSAWDSILAAVALWDFLLLFFCLPVIVFQQITHRRLLGTFSCCFIPYMEVSSFGISTFSLCALGIDHFQAITSAQLSSKAQEHCKSILGKISIIWIGSLTLALPEIFLWQLNQEHSPSTGLIIDSCVMDPSSDLPPVVYSLVMTYKHARMWWFLGCYFCLPLLFTMTSILVTLRIVGSTNNLKNVESQHQLSWIVAGLAIVYTVCILPENATNILFTYTSFNVPHNLLTLITQFFLFLKCAVTPILLLCISKPLGQAFLDCCCCCCGGEVNLGSVHKTEEVTVKMEQLTIANSTSISELQFGTPC